MIFKFLSPATSELQTAADFYEKQAQGLGYEFLDEVRSTIDKIIRNPQA